MQLLQIMASNKRGGAERFFCRLAHSFAEHKLQQSVMVRKDSPYVNELAHTMPCITAPCGGFFDFRSKRVLKQFLKEQHPDIVMTWMNRATELVGRLHSKKHYQHIARLGGYYNLKYYQHCDQFIGNTQGICDYIVRSGIAANRVHHISNFVTETPGTPLQRPRDQPLLATLARLHPNKGLETLIEAMTHVKQAELWIGGAGPLHASLQKLITQLNLNQRVKLLGFIDKPEDVIATCDLFICPSRHEPLGNVILEAWAQSKPVLSTCSRGATELITHAENGYLTPIDDAANMATAIKELLKDSKLMHTLAQQGHARYEQCFSKDIITTQYLALFDVLTKQHLAV